MSCEGHFSTAIAAILSAHPGAGMTAADVEKIYQTFKRQPTYTDMPHQRLATMLAERETSVMADLERLLATPHGADARPAPPVVLQRMRALAKVADTFIAGKDTPAAAYKRISANAAIKKNMVALNGDAAACGYTDFQDWFMRRAQGEKVTPERDDQLAAQAVAAQASKRSAPPVARPAETTAEHNAANLAALAQAPVAIPVDLLDAWEAGALDEQRTIPAIRRYLLTPEQKANLRANDLEISDVLNGNVPTELGPEMAAMLTEWNTAAGRKLFHPEAYASANELRAAVEKAFDGKAATDTDGNLVITRNTPSAATTTAPSAPPPPPPPAPASTAPYVVGRNSTPPAKRTGQEHILAPILRAAPDPYLATVPARLGGQLATPLDLNDLIPAVDSDFEINTDNEIALQMISTALQTGDEQMAAFYLSGKPGSGKNTILRQVAASIRTVDADGKERQGLPYWQADIVENTVVDDLIGGTVIENGSTRWRPGPLAVAALSGSVIALNEVVRQPKAATLLQSIMEDREIQVKTPDGGLVRVPIHPSTIIAMTGNPGSDRDPDRPGAAAFTRTIPIKVEYGSKDERKRRLEARYSRRIGTPVKTAATPTANRVKRRDYTIRTEPLLPQELNAVMDFMDELEALIEARDVQARTGGGRPVVPGPRGADRFVALGKGSGDWRLALNMIKPYCTQDPEMFKDEWGRVETLFNRKFNLSADGAFVAPPAMR